MDIARYFPSIDHGLLKEKLRRCVKDREVLALLDRIIDFSPPSPDDAPLVYFPGDDLFTPLERRVGIPIGNLTSQFFANLYLDAFDHFMKERLGVEAYLRYVDDMVILDEDKARLSELHGQAGERLGQERLRLHPHKAHIVPVRCGLDLLGYRVFAGHRRLRNDNGWRFVRKLRGFAAAYAERRLDWADFDPAVQSWIGHASHADTWGLRKRIFRVSFSLGERDERQPAGDSRRFLEQQTGEPSFGQPQQEQPGQPEQQLGVPPRPVHPCGFMQYPEPAPSKGRAGRGAWVSMSPLPGLARMGAPNRFAREDRTRSR